MSRITYCPECGHKIVERTTQACDWFVEVSDGEGGWDDVWDGADSSREVKYACKKCLHGWKG